MTRAQSVIASHVRIRSIRLGHGDGDFGEFHWKGKPSGRLTHLEWCNVARYCRKLIFEEKRDIELRAQLIRWRDERDAQRSVLDWIFG